MKIMLFLFLAFLSLDSFAKPMIKCTFKGSVSYQFKPCVQGDQEIIEEVEPAQSDQMNALKPDYSMTVGELSVKYDRNGINGDVWFVYKFRVSNNTAYPIEKLFIFQAVNFDGFELCKFTKIANVNSNSTEIITGSYFMPFEKWNKVYKWKRIND
jgi:hypothetical protein